MNANKPAFPTNARMHSDAQGLTKREYFAGVALNGILHGIPPGIPGELYYEKICKKAIKMADELLKQLDNQA